MDSARDNSCDIFGTRPPTDQTKPNKQQNTIRQQVVPAPVEEVLGCEAYLLFYQSLESLLLQGADAAASAAAASSLSSGAGAGAAVSAVSAAVAAAAEEGGEGEGEGMVAWG